MLSTSDGNIGLLACFRIFIDDDDDDDDVHYQIEKENFICTLDKNPPAINRDPVFICILYKWQNSGTRQSGKSVLVVVFFCCSIKGVWVKCV